MNQTDDGTEPLGEAPEVFRPGRDPLYAAAQLLESRGYAVVELPKPIQNGLGGFLAVIAYIESNAVGASHG
ncbi:hypothetical protein [Mycobacteroides abscessus]|uniref:hypothetical protein n=1 Tax=Mycobacteroides abscessus TaxID=36809 RepID=UPI0010420DD5|nr:hypothetical protein [Mycobacteroides abscessus]MDO3045213.1 hypothetical protein [Mycobacteroides abscessus subsp. abscessus]MDO3137094.1 hypothetical protein [Mycobacteroides abscessus subsp. abscessus]MDO3151681.1 hypothetical protein [Mycobacteroides abscessus subsp. abscessus]